VADWTDSSCIHAGSNDASLDDYGCCVEVRGSFQETAPIRTAEYTVKHHDGGVG